MWLLKKKRKVLLNSLKIERDIHTHLLPKVDDGRFTFDSAVETLARMNVKGVRRVCLTPHIITGLYGNSTRKLSDMFNNLRNRTEDKGAIPELSLGAEYMIDETLLTYLDQDNASLFTVTDKHVLIEMSYYCMSPQIFDVVSRLSVMGYTPVLAHPERYSYMDGRSDLFDKLNEAGCTFQLNLLSAAGIYGEASMRIMRSLFERSYYTFVGSDVHSPKQFDLIYGSSIDPDIARQGERASLWNI